MSIKRPSRSSGTGARMPATAPAVRHVDVMAPQQMVAGNLYSGWLCKNKSCGLLIAIAVPPAGSKPAAAPADDPLIVIKCPHCADENLYRWSARGEHSYAAKGAAS
jgi:hypothetical protein